MNKRLGALLAALALALTGATACGNQAASNTAEPAVQVAAGSGSRVVANDLDHYRVVVVDGQGQPVANATVQFCTDSTCLLGTTDEQGIAAFDMEPGTYTVHALKVPSAYQSDATEYVTLNTYCDVIIMLAPEVGESGDDVRNLPKSGVTFTVPDFMKGLKGQLSFVDAGETELGSGIYRCSPGYLGRSDAEAEEFEAFSQKAKDEELGEEAMARADEYYDGTIHAEPCMIVTVSDGHSIDEAIAEMQIPQEALSSKTEIGKAGDYIFYLLMVNPDVVEEYVPEGTAQEFLDEYRMLATQDPAAYLDCIQIKEPVRDFQPAEIGGTITFETRALDGTPASSADIFAGHKVTMINIWATWCDPCKNELAELERLSQEFEKQGCQIVGVCYDADSEEVARDATKILEERGVTYPNFYVFDGLDTILPPRGYPTSYFVDSEGKLLTLPVAGALVETYPERLAEALEKLG